MKTTCDRTTPASTPSAELTVCSVRITSRPSFPPQRTLRTQRELVRIDRVDHLAHDLLAEVARAALLKRRIASQSLDSAMNSLSPPPRGLAFDVALSISRSPCSAPCSIRSRPREKRLNASTYGGPWACARYSCCSRYARPARLLACRIHLSSQRWPTDSSVAVTFSDLMNAGNASPCNSTCRR